VSGHRLSYKAQITILGGFKPCFSLILKLQPEDVMLQRKLKHNIRFNHVRGNVSGSLPKKKIVQIPLIHIDSTLPQSTTQGKEIVGDP
jgi:hypothetical protein